MEPKEIYIKYVAIYLRKSRGENESDLIKHQTELRELCQKNQWKYVEYKEIESGDNIALRPVFQKLLQDIEDGMYDAVCVIDIDRLGRGDLGDQDRIKKAFLNSGTFVVTPQQIYNLENENDEFTVDIRSFIARVEYKQIVKRLLRGKKIGSKLGQWTNGIPPYPYEYQKWKNKYNEKGLVVNDNKLPIYRRIIESYIYENKSTSEIAWELNKENIPSPRGKMWRAEIIRRLLIDETHLGKIISNKTSGDAHKIKKPNAKPFKKNPKDQWIIVENCHEAVKTQEEHEKILMLLHSKTKAPRTIRKKFHALSGLVKCGICGHTMQVIHRKDRKTPDTIKPCWYKDAYGNKCPNSGGLAYHIFNEIENCIDQYEEKINKRIKEKDNNQIILIQNDINKKIDQIKKQEKTIDFIYDQYEKGIYNEKIFIARREKAEKELEILKNDLEILQLKLKYTNTVTDEKILERIKNFKQLIKTKDILTPEELNKLYRTIIDSIIWKRNGSNGDIEITINFL